MTPWIKVPFVPAHFRETLAKSPQGLSYIKQDRRVILEIFTGLRKPSAAYWRIVSCSINIYCLSGHHQSECVWSSHRN